MLASAGGGESPVVAAGAGDAADAGAAVGAGEAAGAGAAGEGAAAGVSVEVWASTPRAGRQINKRVANAMREIVFI